MSSSSLTKHRIFQWMGIILALGIIAVSYYYYRSQASTTINKNISSDSLSEGLAGYWKLDDGSGTSATDSSTNGNTGTLTNGPTWTTGQVGGALDFDGSNDYVTMGDQSIHEGMAKMALAGWIKMDTLPATNYFMISKSSGIGQYRLAVSSGGVPTFVIATTNNAWYSSGTTASGSALTTGTWIHLLGTYDGQYVRLYVNGVLVGTGSQAISGSIVTDTSEFRLSYDSYGNYFNGQIDEVRLYNRALTSEEAANLYHLTSPTGVDTSLKGYWSFNGSDISGTTAYDRSGVGNNGTLTNSPTKTIGKVGQALDFDGSDDYVTAGDINAIDSATELTACAWVKHDTITSDDAILSKEDVVGGNGIILFRDDVSTVSGRTDIYSFVVFDSADSDSTRVETTSNVSGVGKWTFVCGTYVANNVNGLKIYVDGTQSDSTVSTLGISAISGGTNPLVVGIRSDITNMPYDGLLDEVRIYNRALTAAQIKSLYDAGQSDKTNSSASQSAGTGRLDSGLAGYWKLDDGSSTIAADNATDSSTNGNTGTLTNSPTWTTGQIGSAVDFDGTDDYITVADTDTLDITDSTNFTLSGWFNRDTATTDDTIVAKSNGQTSADTGYNVYIDDSTDKVTFVAQDGTDQYKMESVSTFTATGWHHFALSWSDSSSSETKLFIDGTAEAVTTTGTFANVNSLANAVAFRLGAESDNDNPFDGKLDEIRLYNRALSEGEVADLYRLTSPTGVDTSLKGYWSFNGSDISGTTAYDRSGVGSNGTLTNSPAKTLGKIGQALSFDGTNDYVSLTDGTQFDPGGAASWCLWFYTTADNSAKALFMHDASSSRSGTTYKWIAPYLTTNSTILQGYVRISGTAYNTTATGSYKNRWVHTCTTFDKTLSSARLKTYIDGVLATTADAANGNIDAGGFPEIGRWENNGTYFNGKIDEVRMYSRALSAAEIKSLYDAGQSDKTNSSASQSAGTGRLDSGLAGYWKLDDGSGTSATDSSTNGNTGTLTNSPTWTTGQIGSAVDFDGTDDYITVADTDALDITDSTNFTLSGWFNRDTATTDDTIVAKSNGQTSADTGYNIYIDDSTDKVTFVAQDGTDQYKMESVSTFTATGWQHYVVVWDDSGSGQTKLYINGVAEAVTTTGTFANVNSLANAVAFRLGAESDNGNPFDGKLDEIRLYNRALSEGEVADLYRLTSPTGVDTSLKGYWSFNGSDVSGTTAYDRSGAGNNGTLTNGPTKTFGKIGQAISFDGTDDYVDAGTASAIQSLDQLSVSAWVNIANYPAAGDDYIHAIVSTQNDSGSYSGWTLSLGSYADSAKKENILFEFRNVGNTAWRASSASATELALNTWYHVVATYDQSNIKVYINGVIDTTTAQTDAIADGSGLHVGRKYAGSAANRNWEGKIDEVRVYNRALSASEISALYNASR